MVGRADGVELFHKPEADVEGVGLVAVRDGRVVVFHPDIGVRSLQRDGKLIKVDAKAKHRV